MKIEILLQDLSEFLLGHMRYSMGKQTFAPYICCDLIKRYSGYLSISQKEDLIKNIKWSLDTLKNSEFNLSENNKTNTSPWEEIISYLEKRMMDEPSGGKF